MVNEYDDYGDTSTMPGDEGAIVTDDLPNRNLLRHIERLAKERTDKIRRMKNTVIPDPLLRDA
jgi:hypothetical protein